MFSLNLGWPVFGLVGGVIAILFGILILAFPRILNYLVGIALLLGGIAGIMSGSLLPGILSIIFGIVVFIFPKILNYLVGIYFIIMALTMILGTGFAMVPLIMGIILFIIGIIILVTPQIINVLIGLALIISGFMALASYFHWF